MSGYLVQPLVGWIDEPPGFRPDEREVEEVLVVSLDELRADGLRGTFPRKYMESWLEIPCWRLPGGILWGATAMILAELLELIDPHLPPRGRPAP